MIISNTLERMKKEMVTAKHTVRALRSVIPVV